MIPRFPRPLSDTPAPADLARAYAELERAHRIGVASPLKMEYGPFGTQILVDQGALGTIIEEYTSGTIGITNPITTTINVNSGGIFEYNTGSSVNYNTGSVVTYDAGSTLTINTTAYILTLRKGQLTDTITTNQTAYTPLAAFQWLWSVTVDSLLVHGIDGAGRTAGDWYEITNLGPYAITLKHLSGTADAQDRLHICGEEDLLLGIYCSVFIQWVASLNSNNGGWVVWPCGCTGEYDYVKTFDDETLSGSIDTIPPPLTGFWWRLAVSGNLEWEGLDNAAAPEGTWYEVTNVGSGSLVFRHLDGAAGAGTQFYTHTAADAYIAQYESAFLQRINDGTRNGWLVSKLGTRYQMSITRDMDGLMLVNDEANPGNSEYYGTNTAGTKGFYPLWAFIPKTADETVNNSDVLQDDDVLQFAVSNGVTYCVRMSVFFAADFSADFKFSLAGPAITAAHIRYQSVYGTTGSFGILNALGGTASITGSGGTAEGHIWIEATFTPSAGGTFKLQWAQNTAHASNATVYKGSYLEWRVAS
jgi:hypothetical protein